MDATNKTLTDDKATRLVARLTARLAREGRKDLANAILDAARPLLSK